MRILKDSWAIIVLLVLIVVCTTTLCQRNNAIYQYVKAEITIEQRDTVIYALETRCRLQVRDIKMWEAKNLALAETIVKWRDAANSWEAVYNEEKRWSKVLNEAMEGRIRKMAGAYHIREMELLKEIEELKKKLLDCDTLRRNHDTYNPCFGCNDACFSLCGFEYQR